MFWGAAKRYARNNCDYSFKALEKIVPEALNSVSLEQIRRYARRSWRFMDAYRKGLTGIAALYTVKQYRSHRRIPEKCVNSRPIKNSINRIFSMIIAKKILQFRIIAVQFVYFHSSLIFWRKNH